MSAALKKTNGVHTVGFSDDDQSKFKLPAKINTQQSKFKQTRATIKL